MKFSAITIFPQIFDAISQYGITQRALDKKLCSLITYNPRDFTLDNYHRVDDKSFGGGPGMVMKIEPLEKSLEKAILDQQNNGVKKPLKIFLSPQGKQINQEIINQLSSEDGIIFVCGRYEGVDERFIENNIDLEISIADIVVSGGEIPAMIVMDALIRKIPGAVNDQESVNLDSFMDGLLDYPHYTHPRDYKGSMVPDVLLSGNHKQINEWRLKMSLWRTKQRRPELLAKRKLNKLETRLLNELLDK